LNNINRVTLYGNLTREPEHKVTEGGTNITNFSLATNYRWKDKDGEKKEAVQYHDLVAFGWLAEAAATLLKGDPVYVEGRLQTRSWEKPDGTKAYKTEVVVTLLLPIKRQPKAESEEEDASF
jgi:single-strand DNA-binding protein